MYRLYRSPRTTGLHIVGMSTWVPPTHGGSSQNTVPNRRTIIGPDGDGIQFIQAFPIKQTQPRISMVQYGIYTLGDFGTISGMSKTSGNLNIQIYQTTQRWSDQYPDGGFPTFWGRVLERCLKALEHLGNQWWTIIIYFHQTNIDWWNIQHVHIPTCHISSYIKLINYISSSF